MTMMSIGEVARRASVQPSAIRYYEQIGILPPATRKRGRRVYGAEVLDRLALVRMAQAAGLTLAEIRTLLHGFADDTAPPVRWQAIAIGKIEQVDMMVAHLEGVRRALDQSLRCDCPTLEACGRRGWLIEDQAVR